MEKEFGKSGLVRLLVVQSQVAFNDNAAKLALIGLAGLVLPATRAEQATSLMAALLVLPFILFSPAFGWLADRFPKTAVLRGALVFQLAGALGLTASLIFHQLTPAIFCFFLLAAQAALFSPSKQGILKEMVGSERLNQAVSWMESLTIVSILTGGFAGALLLDGLTRWSGNAWTGAALTTALLTAACALSWLVFRSVPRFATVAQAPFRVSILWEHFRDLRHLVKQSGLCGTALGIAWFYGIGGLLYLILVQVGRLVHPGVGAASHAGWLLTLLGLGIVAGALLYGRLSKGSINLLGLPFSAGAMTALLVLLAFLPLSSAAFQVVLALLGVAGGTLIIPLNAFFQDRAHPEERGRMLGAANLLINTAGIVAVGGNALMARKLGFSPSQQMLGLATSAALVTFLAAWFQPQGWLRLAAQVPVRLFYRVRVEGLENLPRQGGALLISNHVSYIDALLLGVTCPRPIHFLAFDSFFRMPILGTILRLAGAIPISPRRPKEAMARAVDLLKTGKIICIFPEGEITRTGEIMAFKRGFEILAHKAEVPVIPICLDSIWGSIFSYSGGRYLWKAPRELPLRIALAFGPALDGPTVNAEKARQAILDLSEQLFRRRLELQENIGHVALRRLAAAPFKKWVVDCTKEPETARCGSILAAALTLASAWKKTLQGRRVGIILPPGRAALAANLAVVLAGRIPVNLNPTVSAEAALSSLKKAGIVEIISARPVQGLFPKYPWPERMIDISTEIKNLSKIRLAGILAAVCFLPARLLASLFRISNEGGDKEAVLLFTSGSSGEPKGVPLTHANVLANINQVLATGLVNSEDRILGCLPLFHSFGMTFGLWMPLTKKVGLVTVPSPLDAAKVGTAVAAGQATILLGTPTFLRSYARKVDPAQFKTLRLVGAGAEKLSEDLARLYKEKYNVEILEGYGLTETAPVLSFNLLAPRAGFAAGSDQAAGRSGSVGRLVPGIAYRLTDPETGAAAQGPTGLLQVRGANVFHGYLDDPQRTGDVLKQGWFTTGDLVRVDEEGFVFIEGRLSRFAKIGGEMVPLARIEEEALRALKLEGEGPALAVVAIPHSTKGEELIFLTTHEVSQEALRAALSGASLPNLWIPKTVRRVVAIPMLATGKIDWQKCKALAQIEETAVTNE